MGFFSFIKNIFAGDSAFEEELDAARARHGIKLTEEEKREAKKTLTEAERFAEEYDVWEDIRNYRMHFFFGSWVTRKIRPVGEEKVKRELEKQERKRREEAKKLKGED
jgi:hypothetical protein